MKTTEQDRIDAITLIQKGISKAINSGISESEITQGFLELVKAMYEIEKGSQLN